MSPTRKTRHDESGQAIVLMVGAIVAICAMVGLIIDGGNAWSQQRIVQNGSDAAAEAGAIVMAQRFAGVTPPAGGWDAAVAAKVNASAAANGINLTAAYYTDICGIPLKPDGTAALTPGGAEDLASADQVGSGALPIDTTVTPDCPSRTAGPPVGVLVLGNKTVATYVARIVGMTSVTISTRATAVAGFLQESCSASEGEACAVLPVTIPVNVTTCSGTNDPLDTGVPWTLGQVYKVPLCKNSPGSVGWLDWTPPGGGIPELINSINTPDNPAIDLPSWQYITQTGNPNSQPLESAIRQYDGQIVLIPQFDLTCGSSPNQSAVNTPTSYGCSNLGGNGQNQWYRIPSFAHFQLCVDTDPDCMAFGVNAPFGAYINGNNRSVCDTGNGATSCLVGKFVSIISTGTVGPGVGGGSGNSKAVGVQLIR
jgi:Flp pilus assembly protein TadG